MAPCKCDITMQAHDDDDDKVYDGDYYSSVDDDDADVIQKFSNLHLAISFIYGCGNITLSNNLSKAHL